VSKITKSLHVLYTGDSGKKRLKRLVLRRFLKAVIDGADVTFCSTVCSTVGGN